MRSRSIALAACALAVISASGSALADSACPELNGMFQCPGAYGRALSFETLRAGDRVTYVLNEKRTSTSWDEPISLVVNKNQTNLMGSVRAVCENGALHVKMRLGILFRALFDAKLKSVDLYALDGDGNLVVGKSTDLSSKYGDESQQDPPVTCHRYSE